MNPSTLILTGDCRVVLATLPPDSVHTVCTSPPYWGLRDYNLPPSIWGGDQTAACEHDWNTERYYREGGASTGSHEAFSAPGLENAARLKATRWRENTVCTRCGAWRGCLGLEPTPELFVQNLVEVFAQVKRVLRPDGTLWLNLGDSYARSAKKGQHRPGDNGKQAHVYDRGGGRASATMDLAALGLAEKNLIGVPWRVAFALQSDGWILRSELIWHKPNPCPESVRDRPTRSHEHVFLFAKSARYFYDQEAIREPVARPGRSSGNTQRKIARGGERARLNTHMGSSVPWSDDGRGRNRRTVWTIAPRAFRGAHFATFPPDLVRPMILAGTSEHGVCATCGAPYRRLRQPTPEYAELLGRDWSDPEQDDAEGRGHFTLPDGSRAAQRPVKRRAPSVTASYETVGWEATCACPPADPVPATVLDPFAGAGTTLLVARELGRNAIGIELSGEYASLAAERLSLNP